MSPEPPPTTGRRGGPAPGGDGLRGHPDAIAALAIAGGAALVLAVPTTGIVLAWPILLAIPGTLLVHRALPGLGAPGRLGAGIAASVIVSAHLVFLLSLPFGYGRLPVVGAAAMLAGASWALATRPLPGLHAPPGRPTRAAVAAGWRAGRGLWLVGGLTAAAVGVILGGTLFHHLQQGWASGAANWSDFLLHYSIAASVQHGNLPPDVPFFAGRPLTYHWFSDLSAALVATAGSTTLVGCMAFGSALMAGSLALVVAELGRTLVGSARAGVIAAVLAVYGGGFGWVRLPMDLLQGRGSLRDLLHTRQYDFDQGPDLPLFHIPPVFEVGILVQRATAYGLPMMVTAVLLVREGWGRSRAAVLVGGLIAAGEAPFNFVALPVTYVLIGLVLVERRFWRTEAWGWGLLAVAAPAVYALPFVLPSVVRTSGTSTLHLVSGWSDGPVGQGVTGYTAFYALNLGIPAGLAALALLRRSTAARLLLGGWVAILAALPNVVQVSFVSFDSSKFFQLMWIGVALLAGSTLQRVPRVIVVPLVAVSSLTAVAGAVFAYADGRVVLSDAQYAAATWIEANTPQTAVFVTPSFINQPTDLAGRLRLTGFPAYSANYGYDQAQRDADIAAVYCGGDITAARTMAADGATYVVVDGAGCAGSGTDFASSPLFTVVYDVDGITVVHLRG